MPVIPPGFAQVNFRLTLPGDPEPMMVTWGAELEGEIPTDVIGIANGLNDAFHDAFTGAVVSTYSLQGTTLIANVGGSNHIWESDEAPRAFTAAASGLPQNCSYLIRKNTTFGGRTGRGRMYLPGVPESSVSDAGVITGSIVSAMTASAQAFLSAANAVDGIENLVLLHAGPPDVDPYRITSLACDNRIATQRRRLR